MATSSKAVRSHLDQVRCTGDHLHQPVIGGSKITARAGHYPGQLAKTMVLAMEEEFERQFSPSPRKLWLRKMEVVMKFQVMKKNKWPLELMLPLPRKMVSLMDLDFQRLRSFQIKRLHENTAIDQTRGWRVLWF